ncbi:MAG TPA: Na+/H+ antiporter NhaA [Streptosporangiaceae bacterium]
MRFSVLARFRRDSHDSRDSSSGVGGLAEFLRQETTGGKLLLAATALALLWANLTPDGYERFWDTELGLGPRWLHLHLAASAWVSEGLLAVFFFIAGMEVKRELTVGELAGWRTAVLPLLGAIGGIILPAIISLAASGGRTAAGGAWAIPVATDIAFALGVLALVGSALPPGVRVLLLSLAVIDDLCAIGLVAVLFTHDLNLVWLVAGLGLCAGYGWAQRRRITPLWVVLPLMVAAWICIHASGVHATVTGIVLGLLTPVRTTADEAESPAVRLEHRLHPVSAGVIVPLFALAAAGIPLATAGAAVTDPIAYGTAAGLLIGKTAGILGGAWLAIRLGIGSLPTAVGWREVFPVAVLGGIGYTVSLLIAQLATPDRQAAERASTAVLAASLVASIIAVLLLRRRSARPGGPVDSAAGRLEGVAWPGPGTRCGIGPRGVPAPRAGRSSARCRELQPVTNVPGQDG